MKTENVKPNLEEIFAMDSGFTLTQWAEKIRNGRNLALLVQIVDGEIINAGIEQTPEKYGFYSRCTWYILDVAGASGTPYYNDTEDFKQYSVERARESLNQKLEALYSKIDNEEIKAEIRLTIHVRVSPYSTIYFDVYEDKN